MSILLTATRPAPVSPARGDHHRMAGPVHRGDPAGGPGPVRGPDSDRDRAWHSGAGPGRPAASFKFAPPGPVSRPHCKKKMLVCSARKLFAFVLAASVINFCSANSGSGIFGYCFGDSLKMTYQNWQSFTSLNFKKNSTSSAASERTIQLVARVRIANVRMFTFKFRIYFF